MKLDVYQKRALFDLICWVLVLAVLACLIGTLVGCATGTAHPALDTSAARLRPIRIAPEIVRLDDNRCIVMAGELAVAYSQGGVTRSMTTPFPCPTQGNAKTRWGSGTRLINVQYEDGQRTAFVEVWP